jgi:hypothetical protein
MPEAILPREFFLQSLDPRRQFRSRLLESIDQAPRHAGRVPAF